MIRLIVAVLTLALVAVPALAVDQPKSDDEKSFYAVGLIVARQLGVFNLTPRELDLVQKGIEDGVTGKTPLVKVDEYQARIQQIALARRNAEGEKLAAQSKDFLEKAAKEKGAVKTASGVIYQSLKEGEGAKPGPADKVKVNYRGTLIDGKEFDSSYAAGQPAEFQLDKVIPCWTEGVQMMRPGGKARLVCPASTAYADQGSGLIPPNAALIFEVELLEVVK